MSIWYTSLVMARKTNRCDPGHRRLPRNDENLDRLTLATSGGLSEQRLVDEGAERWRGNAASENDKLPTRRRHLTLRLLRAGA